jgi:hypothetical protein
MHSHADVKELNHAAAKLKGALSRLRKFLVTLLSAPAGDQGGWESGARGL